MFIKFDLKWVNGCKDSDKDKSRNKVLINWLISVPQLNSGGGYLFQKIFLQELWEWTWNKNFSNKTRAD